MFIGGAEIRIDKLAADTARMFPVMAIEIKRRRLGEQDEYVRFEARIAEARALAAELTKLADWYDPRAATPAREGDA